MQTDRALVGFISVYNVSNAGTRYYLLPDDTIVIMMDVDVDELCSNTVARIPIINPVIGFNRRSLWEKHFPEIAVGKYYLFELEFNKVTASIGIRLLLLWFFAKF